MASWQLWLLPSGPLRLDVVNVRIYSTTSVGFAQFQYYVQRLSILNRWQLVKMHEMVTTAYVFIYFMRLWHGATCWCYNYAKPAHSTENIGIIVELNRFVIIVHELVKKSDLVIPRMFRRSTRNGLFRHFNFHKTNLSRIYIYSIILNDSKYSW